MSETPNVISPRDLAVALIASAIADMRRRIDDHVDHTRNPGSLYHSRIRVYLEQTAFELRRAAIYLEENPMGPDEDG